MGGDTASVGISETIEVRRATAGDAAVMAEVWLRSFAAGLPSVRLAHTPDEVRGWIRDVVVPGPDTWVATVDDAVVGLLAVDGHWLNQLYVEPAWRGRGVGDALVTHAQRLSPGGLQLWTFQVNGPARRFYARHGFTEVEQTDGANNEEREPDVRLEWRPVT